MDKFKFWISSPMGSPVKHKNAESSLLNNSQPDCESQEMTVNGFEEAALPDESEFGVDALLAEEGFLPDQSKQR